MTNEQIIAGKINSIFDKLEIQLNNIDQVILGLLDRDISKHITPEQRHKLQMLSKLSKQSIEQLKTIK